MSDSADFLGGVFSNTIEGGRAGASISLGTDSVLATTHDGELFRVRYAECALELGGASGRMWFVRTADRRLTVFCEADGFAQALQRRAPPELAAVIAGLSAQDRARSARTRMLWAAGLTAFFVALSVAYYGFGKLGPSVLDLVPRSVDEQLGELVLHQLTLEGRVIEDAVLTKAVAQIVDRLAPHSAWTSEGTEFRVRVVDAPVVNAFALPGGVIVLHTGLLHAAAAPEQVAGVLAHEMAHVTRRHGIQRIVQSIGVIALVQLVFGDVSGAAATAVALLREGAINSYSREHEQEADIDGVQLLADAEVDLEGLSDFLALLQKREGDLPSVIAWLGTHPDLSQRIADTRQQAGALGKQRALTARPFALDWPEVQRRAGLPQPDAPVAEP